MNLSFFLDNDFELFSGVMCSRYSSPSQKEFHNCIILTFGFIRGNIDESIERDNDVA